MGICFISYIILISRCQRITSLVMERSELDSAMSWLSTLGGAYSALGDQFSYCVSLIYESVLL